MFIVKLGFYFLFLILLFFGHSLLAQEERNDEEYHECFLLENSFSIGLGAPYSFNINTVGINSRLYYNVGERLCFGPEVSYFKNNELEVLDLNLVVHYIFETPIFGVYPVTGINLTTENENERQEKATGFVYGIGLHRKFNNVLIYTEYTRVESQIQNQFLTAGVMYMLRL